MLQTEVLRDQNTPMHTIDTCPLLLHSEMLILLENPKRRLGNNVERKQTAISERSTVDWSQAESLAFGSLLLEGVPVRLSGEDCVRGTFSQRHLIWWDTESARPSPYTPLRNLSPEQALEEFRRKML